MNEEKERKNLLVVTELFGIKTNKAGVPDTIPLSKTGVYTPAYGRAREIKAEHFEQMLRNFNNKVMKTRISVYYSHWDMRRTAAGELTALAITDDAQGNQVLEGTVAWTPSATKSLEEREYKYVSAEIDFDFSRARDTDGAYDHYGVVLTGVALTNEPAVYDLPAIVFSGSKKFLAHFSPSCSNDKKPTGGSKMDKVFKALGVKTEDEALAKFSMLTDKVLEMEKGKKTDDFSKQLAKKDEEIAALTKGMQNLKDEHFSKEKKDYLDKAFESEKITKEKHQEAMEYGEDKFSMFKDLVESFGDKAKTLDSPAGTRTVPKDAGKPEEDLVDFAKKFKSIENLDEEGGMLL